MGVKNRNSIFKKLQKEIFAKQLVTPVGLTFLGLIAVFFGLLASKNMIVISFAIIGLLIAAFIINICIFKPIKGYYLIILLAFFRPNLLKINRNQWKIVIPYGLSLGAMNLIFYQDSPGISK